MTSLEAVGNPELILARELSRMLPDDPAARRAAARGELRRIRRGVYVRADEWADLGLADRYRSVCRGLALSRRDPPVLSHWSAAAVWRLPSFGKPPNEVHIAIDQTLGGRSRNGIRAHALALNPGDIEFVEGVPVTSLRRTVIDMAASADVHTAIAIVDRAIHQDRLRGSEFGLSKEDLFAALDDAGLMAGRRRAHARIRFGEEASGSPAESASRATMALIGIPEPELQRSFDCELGRYEVDFYWRNEDAIGEVDGKAKYVDPRLLADRSAAEVVYAEKVREDELRGRVRAFGRWDARTALSTDRLRTRLASLGLHPGRPRLFAR
jgi:hypothetical protein